MGRVLGKVQRPRGRVAPRAGGGSQEHPRHRLLGFGHRHRAGHPHRLYQGDAQIQAARLSRRESARQDITLLMTEQSLIRSIDATYLALQKAYEEFKVKAPLINVEKDSITAFIGLKEGITGKSEFEVLERRYNKKKEIYEYKKVRKLKVDKKRKSCYR